MTDTRAELYAFIEAPSKGSTTMADIMLSLPDISGAEFDAAFEQIEAFRHDPIMMQVRDVEL